MEVRISTIHGPLAVQSPDTVPRALYVLTGSGFLVHDYNDSLILALRTVYPEHEWLEWKFNRVPQNFWASLGNHIKWTQWAAQQLGINVRSFVDLFAILWCDGELREQTITGLR
jgi:hypothetical protein